MKILVQVDRQWRENSYRSPPPVGILNAKNAKSFVESKEIISPDTDDSTAFNEKRGVKGRQYAVYDGKLKSKICR